MDFGNQYLDYSEYKKLGGNLQQMPFNLLEFEARKEIDRNTHGRLKTLSPQLQEVKLCVNALISKIQSFQESGNVASESVDGYSVTFATPLTSEQRKKLFNIIKTYLSDCILQDGTPYLYCGADK